MAKCFTLTKTLLFAFLAMTFLLSTSCKKKDKNDQDDHIGSQYDLGIEEIIVNESQIFDFLYNSVDDPVDRILADNGSIYDIIRTNGDITRVSIGTSGSEYQAKYNADNQIIEHVYESGPFKLKTTFDYLQGYVVAVHQYRMEQQSDGSFSEELIMETEDMINNVNGLQSFKMIQYNASVILAIYYVAVITNIHINTLLNNQAYNMLSLEFTDLLFGISNRSKTCVEQIKMIRESDSSVVTMDIAHKYDSDGNIIEKKINSSQVGSAEIKHNITYRKE